MAYIKRFQEIFKKEKDKEDGVAYFGSKTKIEKFSEKEFSKNDDLPGIVLYADENAARKSGPYVTKVRITLKSIIHDGGNYKIKRSEALFMINKSPMKSDEIEALNRRKQRKAEFSAIDFIMGSKSAIDGFQKIYENFYQGYEVDFVKNLSRLGYDAFVTERDGQKKKYIVFNVHAIELIK
jgi:hypothetical protein